MAYPNVFHILNSLGLHSFEEVIVFDKRLSLVPPPPSPNECNTFAKSWMFQCSLRGGRKTSVCIPGYTYSFAYVCMCTYIQPFWKAKRAREPKQFTSSPVLLSQQS